MVRAIHRHCGLGQSVPVAGRLSDSLVRSSFLIPDMLVPRACAGTVSLADAVWSPAGGVWVVPAGCHPSEASQLMKP